MAIVTVSRQMGSLGDEIARRLAAEMGVDAADRDILDARLRDHGVTERHLDRYDEKRPGFWESFSTDKDLYLHALKTAILDYAQSGEGVVIGRGGTIILHDVPGVVHLRCVAPMEVRVPRIARALDCDEPHAEKVASQSDHDRSGFYRFFFHCSWSDRELYDVIINTARLSTDTAVGIVLNAVKSAEIRAATVDAARRIEERALAERVVAAIRYEHEIPVRFLTAQMTGTSLVISGSVNVPENALRCEEIARSVEGVESVKNEVAFVPEYYGPVM